MSVEGKRVLVTGGTESLGQTVVRRLLSGEIGTPEKVVVFSRDEAKQHSMRLAYHHRTAATDEIIYRNSMERLHFRIGDVRDTASLIGALRESDIVMNAAAMKQVPTCEYFPYEAVRTNIDGAQNIVRAIRDNDLSIEAVVGISTDKACKPVNVMGMSKAIQERIFIQANMEIPQTRLVCVRYGNVISSRGSVVPLFLEQIAVGGPVTITVKEMTRFLMSLDYAVDTVFAALSHGRAGETYIPRAPSARVVDIAAALIGDRSLPVLFTGIRPGEKLHEVLVSEEERFRTLSRDGFYVIQPILPELRSVQTATTELTDEYSSKDSALDADALCDLLAPHIDRRTVPVGA